MRNFRLYPMQRVRRLAVAGPRAALVAFALLALALLTVTPAHASPETSAALPTGAAADPVSRFLAERGLLSAPGATPAAGLPGTPAPTENALVGRLRDTASDMVLTAMNFLGVPYKRGGSSAERGFDCSGFTRHVFELSLGLVLPHRADEQATTAGLTSIGRDQLKPGDLVFFNTLRRTFSHVGIYVGGGKFIHSPKPGGEVRVDDMAASYWNHRFTGARRADAAQDALPVVPAEPAAKPPMASARNIY